MPVVYGYARCSTNEERQDIDRQKRELYELGVVADKHIFWEYESGEKTDRDELIKLLDIIREGDTIVSTEVSRLARTEKQLCDILQTVQEKHVRLIIGTFVADCRSCDMDPMTKGMLMMWGVFAEMELNIISERVKSGIRNARAKGKQIGRPKTTAENIPEKFWRYYAMYTNRQINLSELARMMNCSRTTVYKYMELAEEAGKIE